MQQQTSRIRSADTAERDLPLRCVALQIGVELHVNDRTVQTRMHDAWRLVTLLPGTVDALERGRITKAHADAILAAGGVLDDAEVRAAFERVVLEWAEAETVGRTRAYARRLAERLNPVSIRDRHADAAQARSITVVDLEDGMSQIIALVPTVLARGIVDRLTTQAKKLAAFESHAARDASRPSTTGDDTARDDATTRDAVPVPAQLVPQHRSDTRRPVHRPPPHRCPVHRPHLRRRARWAGRDPCARADHPSHHHPHRRHHGGRRARRTRPRRPDTARRLAGNTAAWDRVMYDPVTAVVTAVDRYRPTPAQQRLLRARDRHCRAPGCRMPARRCQLDHNHEHHLGGPTAIGNLACLCVRHHTLKTETGWTVTPHPDGTLEWTSPSGRTARDRPPPVVFVPDEPAPF